MCAESLPDRVAVSKLCGVKTRACEFPCDNDAFHEGSWWVLEEHGVAPARQVARVSSVPPALPAEYLEACNPAVLAERHESGIQLRAHDSDPPAALDETIVGDEDLLSVEDLEAFEPDEVVGESLEVLAPPPLPLAEQAASIAFIERLTRVTSEVGGETAAQRLNEALAAPSHEVAPLLSAWKGILDCESDDLSACGGQTLDEFAAQLAANALGAPERQAELRRALRSAGIAAFGLLDAA
jgi:hypothetical protein